MAPRFLRRKSRYRREQLAKCRENFMHRSLGCTAPSRVCGIAIHPVFGDVDVETAQIDRAKLVERVINLVKLETLVTGATLFHPVINPLHNPTTTARASFPS